MAATGPKLRSPVQRLVAEGRLLAGFLNEQGAAKLQHFVRAPLEIQNAVREKFGAASRLESGVPSPVFRRVDEPDVVDMLSVVAHECGGPGVLHNLVGFEWINIDGIIAGHYLAAPFPMPGRFPTAVTAVQECARYALFGSSVAAQDLLTTDTGDLLSPEHLRLTMTGLQFRQQAVSVEYAVNLRPSPISVLLVDNRVIALKHLERLVALQEGGAKEALCLVFYGYGLEALGSLPTIDAALMRSSRPPLIADFSNQALSFRIPVATPRTLLRFSHTVVDMSTLA